MYKNLLYLLFFVSNICLSANYYVDTTGNDNNSGTISSPFKTINKGVSVIIPGDTLFVRGGVYAEKVYISKSGTSTNPLKISSYLSETPIIDGKNFTVDNWMGLLSLMGQYIDVNGFEIKNSSQRGVLLYGNNNSVHNMNVHDIRENGILIEADNCLVENSEVWNSAMSNYNSAGNGMWSGGLNAARGADGVASNNIIRNNIVHDNWGEGLSTFESNNTIIEDNIVYNNYSVNLYISDTRNNIIQRNIVYNIGNPPLRNGNPASGITNADEVASKPRSTNNIIINNLLKDVGICGMCWSLVGGATFDNGLIAHNTIVNGNVNNGQLTNGSSIINNLTNAVVVGGNVINGIYFVPTNPTFTSLLQSVPSDFFKNTRNQQTTIGAIDTNSTAEQPPPVTNINIALNMPVSVSSTEKTSLTGNFAVDGNKNTRWSSAFSDPQWITIDLQKTYKVNQINLFWETAYSKNFNIQMSNDNVNWTNIYTVTNFTGGNQTLNIMGSGRYIKLYSTSRGTPWGVSLWEIQAFGTEFIDNSSNIALNKQTTTSSVEKTSLIGKYAVDGDKNTRWSSAFSDPQWISVDLGAVYNISKINLFFERAYSSSYKLQVSLDNNTWTDVYYTTQGVGGNVTLSSISGVGQFIRFYGIARGTPWGHSLWEFEVYGTPWN